MISENDVNVRDMERSKSLPASQFYWAIIDGSMVTGPRRKSRLGYLFEQTLPVPIEDVHAVYTSLPDGQIIACGMEREELRKEIAREDGPELLELSPNEVPAVIQADVSTYMLNLLVGDFEPCSVRRQRARARRQVVIVALICCALIVNGVHRRIAAMKDTIDAAYAARDELVAEVLPENTSTINRLPPGLRLAAELRRLRQTRTQPVMELVPTDVVPEFVKLLSLWPNDLHVQTDSMTFTPTNITIRSSLPRSADVQILADALMQLPHWQLQQPQVSTSRSTVSTSLQFKRTKEQPTR